MSARSTDATLGGPDGSRPEPGDVDARQVAWNEVRAQLPEGWRTGRGRLDPSTRRWLVVALSRRPNEPLTRATYLLGEGADEVSALQDLAQRLATLK